MKLNYVFYDELLDKYYKSWDKVNNSIKKGFHSEPINNKNNEGKINTNFHGGKMPKESFQCIWLSVILIDSVFRTGKNYYPTVFRRM